MSPPFELSPIYAAVRLCCATWGRDDVLRRVLQDLIDRYKRTH